MQQCASMIQVPIYLLGPTIQPQASWEAWPYTDSLPMKK